jgi:CIC family chloride channel protein
MGATIGGAFGAAVAAVHPIEGVTATTGAIIGMAAMVGGGTGAAMTAVTMIFEMTRYYDLVMPSIVAVALAIGVRRLLSVADISCRKRCTPICFWSAAPATSWNATWS